MYFYLDPLWWPSRARTGRDYVEIAGEGFGNLKVKFRAPYVFPHDKLLGQKPSLMVAALGWHQDDFQVTAGAMRRRDLQ